MADGSIRVETKLDTQGVEKGLKDVDKMCDSTKKHIEEMAEQLNIKTNPIEIFSEASLAKAKKRLAEITKQIEKVQAETDKMLPEAVTDEQVLNLLKLEEAEIGNLVTEQESLNKAVDEYEVKRAKIATEKQQKATEKQSQIEAKAAEKQQKSDIKDINADVSGSTQASDFVSKIKDADDYERKLQQVSARIQEIEQKTAKAAAKKGIDGSEALKANKEYQKLTKRYDELVKNADKFKKSSKGGFDSAKEGAKGLGSSMKSAIKTMTKYTLAIFGARSGFYAVKNAIRQVLSDNEQLNNTVTAMKGAFANALAPVIERVVNWIKYAFAYLNLFVKTLTGVDMAAQYNAKAIEKQTAATKKNAQATKEANKQLASFDEMNVMSSDSSTAATDDTGSSDSAALLELPDVSGGKFEEICETIKAHLEEIEMICGAALLAIGFILIAFGQIPLGIACIIGGLTVMAAALGSWDEMSTQTKNMITAIMLIAGGAFLVIGLILIATAVKMPLGIAMVAIGAAMLVAALVLNWDEMPDKIKTLISVIMAAVGVALLVIGFIVISHNLPLGIALIALGAVALATVIALNWDKIKENIENIILVIMAVVSVALLVLGAILAFSGAHTILGIALIAAGAVGLVATLALSWNKLSDETKSVISKIAAIAGAALLVLGVILCITGVNLPLGIALIAAGAAVLVTVAALNKEAVVNWIKEVWDKVKNFWNSHIKPIFTKDFWTKKFDTIKQGMKSAINGVIGIVEKGINWIVSKLNLLSFDIPDWVPGVGGKKFGFNLPYVSLPRLAKGGIVNNPGKGQAVIAGEAGAEAVLPLQNNTEWMDLLVDKVADKVSMTVLNRIYLDSKEIHSSSRKYGSRFDFATNGGVL